MVVIDLVGVLVIRLCGVLGGSCLLFLWIGVVCLVVWFLLVRFVMWRFWVFFCGGYVLYGG